MHAPAAHRPAADDGADAHEPLLCRAGLEARGARSTCEQQRWRSAVAEEARAPPKKEAPALKPPAGWRSTYDLITELRADRTAVVDSMGSEAIATSAGSAEERNYQVLVSLMLSSQTKDTVNAATMAKLRAHGLTMANILATPDDELDELIRAVGFHNNKVKFIKATTRLLVDEHDRRCRTRSRR